MRTSHAEQPRELGALDDAELVRLALQRNGAAFRLIMQRHNQRLYRVARSVVQDDSEAEDVVQEAYVRAFGSLGQFRGDSTLATWLTRIALNEALGRVRRQRPMVDLAVLDAEPDAARQILPFPLMHADSNPERTAAQHQIRQLIERAIDELPEIFRVVFVMRDVQDMSVEETADFLGLPSATVKSRLHRARRQLRRILNDQLDSALNEAFPFDGKRCQKIADEVMKRLQLD
jgi:RNA polymerase sigma-70 factor (ECF subfamily)